MVFPERISKPEAPPGHGASCGFFGLLAALLLFSVFVTGKTHAACGPLDTSYSFSAGNNLDAKKVAKVLEVNGNKVKGKGTALEPDGDLVNPPTPPVLPDLDPSAFPAFGGGNNINIPRNGSGSTGEGTYRDIKIDDRGDFLFTTVGGTYQIHKLEVKKEATVTLAPGDYFIGELKLKDKAQLLISPAGAVRIYTDRKIEFGKQSQVNPGGSVADLQIYAYANVDIKLKEKAKVSALIYSPFANTDIEMEMGVEFRGMAVTAGDFKVKEKGKVKDKIKLTFDAAVQAEVGSISTCVVPPVVAVDAFEFNCVTPGQNPISGHLFTRVAGQAFVFDLAALRDADSDGSADGVETDFASDGDRQVAVELVDMSSGSCATYSTVASQTVTFTAADQGYRGSVGWSQPNAYRFLGCRVTDNGGAAPVQVCSGDSFSIRPAALSVTAPLLGNAAASGDPKAVAGSGFTLRVATVSGYDGTPRTDTSIPVEAHAGAVRAGNLTGAFSAANPVTGSADGSFIYDEVGSFRLQPLGVWDDSFTLVDSGQGDCIHGFGNLPDASGKVGCRFGNDSAGDWVGRFIPNHFRLTVDAHGQLADTCTAGVFSYAGQDVGYQPGGEPVATITAYNGMGTPAVTRNYTGDHNHLTVPGILMSALTGDGTKMRLDGSGAVSLTWNQGVASLVDNGDGTVRLTLSGDSFNYSRADIDRVDPFTSDLDLELQSITDSDGVSATGLPDGFSPAGVQIRYGRLVLENSFGSELLHLPVPLRVEYFDGTANGFVPNADDSCSQVLGISLTDLDASDGLTVSTGAGRETAVYAPIAIAGGYAEENPGNPALLFSQPTAGAAYNLNLQAPGEANTGTVGVLVDAPDWLEYDWQGAGMTDPFSRASFGIFSRAGSAIVYLREMR